MSNLEQNVSHEDMRTFAKTVMKSYFADKSYYCGGKIPPHILYTNKRVDLALNCTMCQAMDIAYEALEREAPQREPSSVDADTLSVLDLLKEMSRKEVPQELRNGMLLIHLELCEGVDVVYS